ncbi:MAG: DUF1854 domain-containing protein [Planctomycetes bacterium]|nr:DUF1854 domain-containing protein [Planctomycetota bacterium]
MTAADPGTDAGQPSPTALRFLTPEICRIHLGTHEALHVTVKGERIYGGVYAAYAFPVAHPDEYIALIHTGGEEEVEIGIIRDLSEFPDADAALVRQALERRYFVHTITGIRRVGWKYGFVNMDVQTDKGPADILIPWRHDRAFDYGRRGKVLIDVEGNRYLIPDLEELPVRQREEFQRYIYW